MKILFYDHIFHNKTKSSGFFVNILKSFADVDIVYIAPDELSSQIFSDDKDVDVFIFWQIMPSVKALQNIPYDKIVFIPMYDACCAYTSKKWQQYGKYKFISFSEKVHKLLTKMNIRSLYIQYMVPIKYNNVNVAKDEKITIFIWKRSETLNLKKLIRALENTGIEKAICHGFDFSDRIFSDKIILEYTNGWFDSHDEYIRTISKCHYFLQPRKFEGIGMAFLEAMSLGLCVISPNQATMNEYITNNVTGYLFNSFSDIRIDESLYNSISKNCKSYCKDLRYRWEKTVSLIYPFINERNFSNEKVKSYCLYDLQSFVDIRLIPFVKRKMGLQDY